MTPRAARRNDNIIGGKTQRLGLFVDTQSLAYHVRYLFDRKDRLDFLRLPGLVLESCRLRGDYVLLKAFVVRRGDARTYGPFCDAMSSFGYQVVQIEDGSQDMLITMHVTQAVDDLDMVILATGNRRLSPLLDQLTAWGKRVYVVTFDDLFEESSAALRVTMDHRWLLTKENP